MKVAYIAHPVGGDVTRNIEKIKAIMREIWETEPNTIPFAPYLNAIQILDDNNPVHRARGMKENEHILRSGIVDELRLYGGRISDGMREEIRIAEEQGVPVVYWRMYHLWRYWIYSDPLRAGRRYLPLYTMNEIDK